MVLQRESKVQIFSAFLIHGTIQDVIPNGQVAITELTLDEANELVKTLQSAWLDVPLTVESQQVIGASTGEKQIKEGLFAIAFGLLAVMVFMLIWYKGAGVNAVVAQILNLYIMFSILSAFNMTVTLPSIAGMILTIGMAVDATGFFKPTLSKFFLFSKTFL